MKAKKLYSIFLFILLVTSSFPVYAEDLKSEGGSIKITTDTNPSRYSAYQVFEYTRDNIVEYNRIRCRYTSDCLKRWFVGTEAEKLFTNHQKDYSVYAYIPCRGCHNHFYTNEEFDNHCIAAIYLNGVGNPCVNTAYDIDYRQNADHAAASYDKETLQATFDNNPDGSYYIFKDSEWFDRVKSYLDTYKDTCGLTLKSYNDGDLYVIDDSAATDSQKEDFYQYLYGYIPIEAAKHSQEKTSSTVSIENLDSGMYLVIGEYDEKSPIKDYVGTVWLNTGNTTTTAGITISETTKEEHQTESSSPATPDGSPLEEMPAVNMIVVSDANVVDGDGNILGFISKGSNIGVSGQCLGYYQVNYGAKRSFLPKSVLANH